MPVPTHTVSRSCRPRKNKKGKVCRTFLTVSQGGTAVTVDAGRRGRRRPVRYQGHDYSSPRQVTRALRGQELAIFKVFEKEKKLLL